MTFPDIAARVLRESNCLLPLGFSASVNVRGAISLTVSDKATRAASYAPYFETLTSSLNQSFPAGQNPWAQLILARTAVQLAIHTLPLPFRRYDEEELFPYLWQAILNDKETPILSTQSHNLSRDSRGTKQATWVVVTFSPQHVAALTSRVVILSQKRKVELAFSASHCTQCRNCWRYGHATQRCPATHPTCPICALHHTRAAHRCKNPTCPQSGNNKQVPSFCPTSAPHCCHCGNDQTAPFKECSARPRPAVPSPPTTPEPQDQDPMDVAVDGDQGPSTPPGGVGPSQMDLVTPRQPPPALHTLVPLKALAVLSPWRNQARPKPPLLVGYVPEMSNLPPRSSRRQASSLSLLSVIQHNCLGSWDVFHSLFESFKEMCTYPSVVLLQDSPVSQARLPSFNGFLPFFPPVRKPSVPSYVHRSFLARFLVLPRFTERVYVMSLNISSPKPVFGSRFHTKRLVNAYSINSADRRVHSILRESLFPDTGIPLLVVEDLNIHNPLSDPVRSFASPQVASSAPFFNLTPLGGFALLHSPGVYTRFHLSGKARPSVIVLAFTNPLLLPFVKGWETSRPSTGSDHVPITILLASPSLDPAPLHLRSDHRDWELLSPIIKNFIVPAPPPCPSLKVLDDWLARTHDRLTGLLKDHTISSSPSHHSKPWWAPHLNILRRESHKAARLAHKQGTMPLRETANVSRTGYFKDINVAKNKHRSSFLLSATP